MRLDAQIREPRCRQSHRSIPLQRNGPQLVFLLTFKPKLWLAAKRFNWELKMTFSSPRHRNSRAPDKCSNIHHGTLSCRTQGSQSTQCRIPLGATVSTSSVIMFTALLDINSCSTSPLFLLLLWLGPKGQDHSRLAHCCVSTVYQLTGAQQYLLKKKANSSFIIDLWKFCELQNSSET